MWVVVPTCNCSLRSQRQCKPTNFGFECSQFTKLQNVITNAKKMTDLTKYDNDNPKFISNIEIIIRDKVSKCRPFELYLTRIDNWFDDKWVKFSGTHMHEISIWQQKDITIPPFHPNRVDSCDYYRLDNAIYKKQTPYKTLHIIQASTDNFKRKIADYTDNGLFIWFSGNSKINNKGTLMGYLVQDKNCYTFYISLTGEKNWSVNKTKGISAKEVLEILKTT